MRRRTKILCGSFKKVIEEIREALEPHRGYVVKDPAVIKRIEEELGDPPEYVKNMA